MGSFRNGGYLLNLKIMEVNELRVGNLILYQGQFKTVRYIQVDRVGAIKKNLQPQTILISKCSGIPLTEEILLKCGFVENGDTMQFHLQGQIVSFNRLDGGNFWIMDTDKGIRCKYLHQLQNTWYTFKGKELEINL